MNGRKITFASCAALTVVALLACSRASNPTSSAGFDVYVPMPTDEAGEAAVNVDASDGGDGGAAVGQIDRAAQTQLATTLLP
jgi:hypothetical protein